MQDNGNVSEGYQPLRSRPHRYVAIAQSHGSIQLSHKEFPGIGETAKAMENAMINLPYGGRFDEYDLVAHIQRSGRDYIIQGQQAVSLKNHRKPHSLDNWLRQFGVNQDTKQAENTVLDALVGTGLFVIVNDLKCPDSGRRCKGLRLL